MDPELWRGAGWLSRVSSPRPASATKARTRAGGVEGSDGPRGSPITMRRQRPRRGLRTIQTLATPATRSRTNCRVAARPRLLVVDDLPSGVAVRARPAFGRVAAFGCEIKSYAKVAAGCQSGRLVNEPALARWPADAAQEYVAEGVSDRVRAHTAVVLEPVIGVIDHS